ncbi:hypothetical protein [Rhodoplanes sp. SY1]|uniref:winged helix domain-containing protein n=1 Tax=Rhodoplanes sp. SY1 TaxID=3166646 RepID=UPI0038B453FB
MSTTPTTSDLFAWTPRVKAAARSTPSPKRQRGTVAIRVRIGGPDGPEHIFRGRTAWALDHLLRAGAAGCTPIDTPGPRWSDYVHKIRKAGVPVQTIDEAHGGAFPGTHARYVLEPGAVHVVEQGAQA